MCVLVTVRIVALSLNFFTRVVTVLEMLQVVILHMKYVLLFTFFRDSYSLPVIAHPTGVGGNFIRKCSIFSGMILFGGLSLCWY